MPEGYLLTIAIPTYNRAVILDRSLSIIKPQLEKAGGQVEFIISDNCSPDNTREVVEYYINNGMNIRYVRNDSNIGADGNINQCYKMAKGKYVWVLGDDDYLMDNAIHLVLDILNLGGDYGLLFHSLFQINRGYKELKGVKDTLNNVDSVITWISGNIIKRDYIDIFNFDAFKGNWALSANLYFNAIVGSQNNVQILERMFCAQLVDTQNSGYYNFFKTFCEDYLQLWKKTAENSNLGKFFYEKKKYQNFRYLLFDNINRFLICKLSNNYILDNAWYYLFKYYWYLPYFYFFIIYCFIRYKLNFLHKIFMRIKFYVFPQRWINQRIHEILAGPLVERQIRWRYINPHNETVQMTDFNHEKVFVGVGTKGALWVYDDNSTGSMLRIGDHCTLGYDTNFILGEKGDGNIILGDNVRIGRKVVICSGVRVGNNAIIQSGTVVTSDIS